MRRKLVPALAALALASLAACGNSEPRVGPTRAMGGFTVRTAPSPTSLRFSSAANRQFALSDVRRLARVVVLPPGARRVSKLPADTPSRLENQLGKPRFVAGVIASVHRLWIVHEPLEHVFRFVRAHVHPRPRPEMPFRAENNGIDVRRPVASYLFAPVPGRSWSRWLNINMVALPGGATAVFVQSGDQWINPPPRRAEIPRGVKQIDIVSRSGEQPPTVLVHVRDKFEVGQIVAFANGLGAVPPRTACLDFRSFEGPLVTLRFRAGDGRVLAVARVPDPPGFDGSGPCNPLQLTIGSRTARPLIGADLVRQIQQLLNIDLAPPPPRSVSSCLRGQGWNVDSPSHTTLTAQKGGKRWTITFHRTGKVTLSRNGPRALERCLRIRSPYVVYG